MSEKLGIIHGGKFQDGLELYINTIKQTQNKKSELNTPTEMSAFAYKSTLPYQFRHGAAVVYNNQIHILGSDLNATKQTL